MNKKQKRFGLLALLCMLSLLGCGPDKRPYSICVGYSETIVGNNTVEVTGSTVSDGKIVVNLILNFEDLTLNDFLEISLTTGEYNADPFPCNVEETVKENEANIFDTPYQGEVSLVFSDDGISAKDDVTWYYVRLDYGYPNGTATLFRFHITYLPSQRGE